MLHGETITLLREVEERFPVANYKVGDQHVWPILRVRLAFDMLLSDRPRAGATPEPPLLKRAWRLAREWRHDAGRSSLGWGRLPKAQVLLLSRPANRQKLGGSWYDRLFDPIADLLTERGSSSLHFEHRAPGTSLRSPRHRPSIAFEPAVLSRWLAGWHRRHLDLTPWSLEGYDELDRFLRAQRPFLRAPARSWLLLRAQATEELARGLETILDEVEPRLVMTSCWYSLAGMSLCLAAQRRGIPSVDVQHGVTIRNPAYEGWTTFPSDGYALVPRLFWCWTPEDTRPVASWPEAMREHHGARVGGHPWMALWETNHPSTAAYVEAVRALKGPVMNVLLTLSRSSGLSPLLEQVIRDSPPDWTWWLRMHPAMDQREELESWCRAHAPGRVKIAGPTELPLPLLLGHADVHLTHNSSVVQEAAASGVPSVVIDRHALDVYTRELASGWACFADHPAQIHLALHAQRLRKPELHSIRRYPPWSRMSAFFDDLLPAAAERGAWRAQRVE